MRLWAAEREPQTSAYGAGEASPYSKPSRDVWGRRSGGGVFGSSANPSTSEGYSKPSAPSDRSGEKFAPGSKFDSGPSKEIQKKDAKDSLEAYRESQTKRKEQGSRGTQVRRSEEGYSKPASQQTATSEPRSEGYVKPIPQPETKIHKFGRDTAFDRRAIEQARKEKAKASLEAYKAERAKFKQPKPKLDADRYADHPVYQQSKTGPGFSYEDYYRRRADHWGREGLELPNQMYKGPPSCMGYSS